MSEIDLRTCPECGVDAIVVEESTELDERVWCNNCKSEFLLKDID